MNKGVVWLLVAGVAITRLWQVFDSDIEEVVLFWASLGLDITKKYDLFAFVEFEQGLRWYAFFASYFIGLILLCWVILIFSNRTNSVILKTCAKTVLFFNIFRLISYWLFWESIEFEILCTAVSVFMILIIQKWRQ